MQKESSKGIYIILAIVVVISLILYFYLKGTPNEDITSTLESSSTPESQEAQAAANRVLVLLDQVNALTIDDSLFSNTAYRTLQDYSITIPEQNVGRPNPFAPIPGLRTTTGVTKTSR